MVLGNSLSKACLTLDVRPIIKAHFYEVNLLLQRLDVGFLNKKPAGVYDFLDLVSMTGLPDDLPSRIP